MNLDIKEHVFDDIEDDNEYLDTSELFEWGKKNIINMPDFCELYTIEEWVNCVDEGYLIDYDGFGNVVYYDSDANVYRIGEGIYPSEVNSSKIDCTVTHIIWYNC